MILAMRAAVGRVHFAPLVPAATFARAFVPAAFDRVGGFTVAFGFSFDFAMGGDFANGLPRRQAPCYSVGMSPGLRRTMLALALASTTASAFVASGCGPSTAEAHRAEHAVYQTEFARVWNAVTETVKEQYPRLAIEDPVHGKLLTDWHLVERVEDDPVSKGSAAGVSPKNTPTTTQSQQAAQQQYQPIAGRFFRIVVVIKPGGPPWKLEIDGEAAQYTPGMAMITPFDHHDADEPQWVQPRIDKIRVGIYDRLAGYARIVDDAPVKPRALDPGPWANLPKGAPEVVAKVSAAADKKDTGALRPLMSDDFTWSAGGTPSADAAVSMWQADPLVLSQLTKVLALGCSERESDALIVCPARGESGPGKWRAEFRKVGSAWRFAAFYQEE
jgi:hypothetical protein